jgi:hypothetical protein
MRLDSFLVNDILGNEKITQVFALVALELQHFEPIVVTAD